MAQKARVAHLAGPNATIQNTPPLVTSNKARAKHQLPLLTNPDRAPARFDVLRPQRLAAPVTVYVEQFSAHPLEADAAELHGPPDGYVDSAGNVHKEQLRGTRSQQFCRFSSPARCQSGLILGQKWTHCQQPLRV